MHNPKADDRVSQLILSDVNIFRRHPSSQDVLKLRALIDANESSLATVNEEIDAYSRQLSALRAKSYAHILTIRRCQAAMSPARLLPPELLAKVFEHASEMGWVRAPIVASQVCSTWRAAAQSHPSVWSRITVNLGIRDPVSWTKHWLSMARQASLHVTLLHTVPVTILGQVMTLLMERSEQWVSLALSLHFADTRQVLTACTTRFTTLRSVRVSLLTFEEDAEAAEITAGFSSAFRDAPSLTSLTVAGNVVPRDLPPLLTSLRIECYDGPTPETPRSIIETLRGLPNLETLTLWSGVANPAQPALVEVPNIELPRLKTLTYYNLHAGDFLILTYLTAPSLVHLHACVQPDLEAYAPPTHLIHFLEGSPNIETLKIDGVDIWPVEWLSTLPLLPKLRRLHLHDSDIDDKVIEGMFGRSGSCPNLRRLDLRWCQHVRGPTLVQLVESRMKDGVCELEEVAAIGCSLVRRQDAMQLARLTRFRVVTEEWDERCSEFGFNFYRLR